MVAVSDKNIPLQVHNRTKEEFCRITDELARRFGCSLRELAPKVDISHAMFFQYRSGNSPISNKAWRKIETALESAGIDVPQAPSEPSTATPIADSPFDNYLKFIRACEQTATRLANGDVEKSQEIFDRLLGTWEKSTTAVQTTESQSGRTLKEIVAEMIAEGSRDAERVNPEDHPAFKKLKTEAERSAYLKLAAQLQGTTPHKGARSKTG